jgi:hypothetical protein
MKVTFCTTSTSSTDHYQFYSLGYPTTGTAVLDYIDGLGAEALVETYRSPYQEGVTYSNKRYDSRQILISFTLMGKTSTDLDTKENEVYSTFNVHGSTGTKLKIVKGSTYEIDALPAKVTLSPKREGLDRKGVIAFECPDPWFKLLPETTVSMNAYSSGFTFPFSFPVYFGLSGSAQTINNNGHVPVPITIVMSGIDTPVLTRSTDKIQLDVDLTSTETVTINTAYGIKSVVKVAGSSTTNEYSHLSVDSNLFYLNKGNNTLSYTNAGQFDNPTFKVKYYKRYAGI